MNEIIIKRKIEDSIIEDINSYDITTDNIFDESYISKAFFLAKEAGVISGINVIRMVFLIIDESIKFCSFVHNGDKVKEGTLIATVEGPTKSILKGERVALNYIQRMSGIASLTSMYVDEISEYDALIVDTRKTTPLNRVFEKQAVRDGGALNHRYNLSDGVMLKDNHIKAIGSIKEAVKKVKSKIGLMVKIEVEVDNIEDFKEALNTEVDVIMLDNMSIEKMRECVILNNKKKIIEASGNMSLSRVKEVAAVGVDYISVGALTHSFKSLDISLKFEK
ncbi:MAG: carboxylating nicotinate-nucleotide diphosphorylase [Bacilli bacterium]|nr:carboxylating nicotinate-nucleotide diphosphorylase [Bacilli bacterium]